MITQVTRKLKKYMEKELLKIVFQDGTPEDKQLSITVYGGKNEEGKTRIDVAFAPMEIMQSREPDFISTMYFDVFNTLGKIKESLDSGKGYNGVHTLTRDEYKEYVTKVLGVKIPDTEDSKKYTEEHMLLAYVNGGTHAKENLDTDILSKNFKRLLELIDTNQSTNDNTDK